MQLDAMLRLSRVVTAPERVADRILEALMTLDEIRGILAEDDAAAMRWTEQHLESACAELECIMKRISN